MLSICIPIYNFNVTKLVRELSNQGEALDIPFEILCLDDCSTPEWIAQNESISNFKGVTYQQLSTNFGRAAIRNLLSKEATFDYQIFMDCDTEVPNKDYLAKYWNKRDIAPVIFGGRSYSASPPNKPEKLLRWTFGKNREVVPATTRNQKPYRYFMTNNFLVKREVITKVPFEESIVGYGHEDTMFAQDLKKHNIKINHIDNPLIHIGLEDATEFITKTENGVKNLSNLIKRNKIDNDNRLFATYKKLKQFGLLPLVSFYLSVRLKNIKANLTSKTPNLFYFDLYKLHLLINAMKSDV